MPSGVPPGPSSTICTPGVSASRIITSTLRTTAELKLASALMTEWPTVTTRSPSRKPSLTPQTYTVCPVFQLSPAVVKVKTSARVGTQTVEPSTVT